MLKIIGIDPGLAATGVGIVRGSSHEIAGYSYGSISTSKETSLPSRLDHIFTKLLNLLQEEKPDLMVLEEVFSLQQYPKSGITLGRVSGVIMLAGSRSGASVVEVPVREAKQVLTGNGNADKNQLERAVRDRLNAPAPIKPNHASDALGLALIGLYRYSDFGRRSRRRIKG